MLCVVVCCVHQSETVLVLVLVLVVLVVANKECAVSASVGGRLIFINIYWW